MELTPTCPPPSSIPPCWEEMLLILSAETNSLWLYTLIQNTDPLAGISHFTPCRWPQSFPTFLHHFYPIFNGHTEHFTSCPLTHVHNGSLCFCMCVSVLYKIRSTWMVGGTYSNTYKHFKKSLQGRETVKKWAREMLIEESLTWDPDQQNWNCSKTSSYYILGTPPQTINCIFLIHYFFASTI